MTRKTTKPIDPVTRAPLTRVLSIPKRAPARRKARLTTSQIETLASIAAGYDHDGDSSAYAGSGSRDYNRIRGKLLVAGFVRAEGNRLWLTGIQRLGAELGKRLAAT